MFCMRAMIHEFTRQAFLVLAALSHETTPAALCGGQWGDDACGGLTECHWAGPRATCMSYTRDSLLWRSVRFQRPATSLLAGIGRKGCLLFHHPVLDWKYFCFKEKPVHIMFVHAKKKHGHTSLNMTDIQRCAHNCWRELTGTCMPTQHVNDLLQLFKFLFAYHCFHRIALIWTSQLHQMFCRFIFLVSKWCNHNFLKIFSYKIRDITVNCLSSKWVSFFILIFHAVTSLLKPVNFENRLKAVF